VLARSDVYSSTCPGTAPLARLARGFWMRMINAAATLVATPMRRASAMDASASCWARAATIAAPIPGRR
jgi:hypothetical protein